ncbi:MAG: glycosyltransferase 87 family protein [Candidatus Nanopelagicales bacterium]
METATDPSDRPADVSDGVDATDSAAGDDIGDFGGGSRLSRVRDWFLTPLPYLLVIAAVFRVWSVHTAGGFRAAFLYDDGVYYSAGTALTHGLMPYRDFVLVHPPGSTVAFAPFGFLAELTSDSTAFAIARVAVICLGVLNTALIYRVAKSVGVFGATTAALLYAVWFPVVFAERSTLLEPFVILGTVGSLALLFNTKVGGWRPWVAGIVAGIGISTKLWAIIPVLVILGAVLVARRFKDALKYVLGTGVAAIVLVLPFFLAAPSNMFQMIVTDQLGRSRGALTIPGRFSLIFNLDAFFGGTKGQVRDAIVLVVLALVVLAAIAAFVKFKPARVWVALLVVQIGVLLYVPVFFTGYPTFAAPAFVLVLGAFGQVLWNLATGMRFQWAVRGVAVAGVFVVFAFCAVFITETPKSFGALPAGAVRAVADGRCVAADRPSTIAIVNRLTSSLQNDCPIVVDFTGSYYSTAQARRGMTNRIISPDFQAGIQNYFNNSDYVIITRRKNDQMSPQTLDQLKARPVVFKAKKGALVIYGPPQPAGN